MRTIIWIMGARGFVGRHVAREAAGRGYQVSGLGHGAWLPEDAATWGISRWINGEVEESNLDLMLSEAGVPDGIFHCAGGSSVGVSMQAPFEDYSRSVTSTARLLEWIRCNAPACRLVLASSAAVYGAGHDGPICEQDERNPASPYGAHKLAAEVLVRGAHHAFGTRAAIVRPFSLYGEELRKQLIWDICMKLHRDANVLELGGTGEELRDFIHVSDAAAFFLNLFDRLDGAADGLLTANCGTGTGWTIRQVAACLAEAWGTHCNPMFSGSRRPGDPTHLVADISHASSLGLEPGIDLASGAHRYVHWFLSQYPVR